VGAFFFFRRRMCTRKARFACFPLRLRDYFFSAYSDGQVRLTAAAKFQIDFGQQFCVEQRAVEIAGRGVNLKTFAQRIKRVGRARELLACDRQCVCGACHRQGFEAESREFGVQKSHVERRVVNDQWVFADKREEVVHSRGEQGLVGEKFVRQTVDGGCAAGHFAFRIVITVKHFSCRHIVNQLDRADFHDAVAVQGIEAGCFRVEDDFAQYIFS